MLKLYIAQYLKNLWTDSNETWWSKLGVWQERIDEILVKIRSGSRYETFFLLPLPSKVKEVMFSQISVFVGLFVCV